MPLCVILSQQAKDLFVSSANARDSSLAFPPMRRAGRMTQQLSNVFLKNFIIKNEKFNEN